MNINIKNLKYFIGIYILLSSLLNSSTINQYDINFKLLQSGELRVSENILYDFGSKSMNKIHRDIPYTININGFNRDIQLYDFKVYQDDKSANYLMKEFYSNLSGKNIRIIIGEKFKTLTAEHKYKIDYSVKLGVLNKNEKYDITSWNLIGNEWKGHIKNIKATVTLPHSLSKENTLISTFSTKVGSKTTNPTIKWIDKNHFQIYIAHLSPKEGLTLNISYPVNSLRQSGKNNQELTLKETIITIWPWLSILIIVLLNYTYLRIFASNKFATSIYTRYNPPKNLSILQSGVLSDKFINHKTLFAGIMELAQQGYLKIQKSRDSTTILKVQKDNINLSNDMNYFLNNILFENRHGISFKNLNELNKSLYEWTYDKEYMITNPKKRRENFLTVSLIVSAFTIIISLFTSTIMVGEYNTFTSLVNLVFIVVCLYFIFFNKNKLYQAFAILIGIAFQIYFNDFYKDIVAIDLIYTPLALGFITAVMVFYTYKRVGRYTMQGAKIKNHLDGFSRFISMAPKDEIKRKLKFDPLYIERYLPYAILFGHDKHWLSFYSKLDIQSPHWYSGNLNEISSIFEDLSSNSFFNNNDRIDQLVDHISDIVDDGFSYSSNSSGNNYSGGDSDGYGGDSSGGGGGGDGGGD